MHPKLLLSPVSYPWELLEMEMMVPVPSTESKTLGIGLRNLVYKAVCVIWCTLKSGSHGLHQSIHHSMKKSMWPRKVNTHINWWQLIVMNHSHNNASFFPQYYIYTFWVWGWLWVVWWLGFQVFIALGIVTGSTLHSWPHHLYLYTRDFNWGSTSTVGGPRDL